MAENTIDLLQAIINCWYANAQFIVHSLRYDEVSVFTRSTLVTITISFDFKKRESVKGPKLFVTI